MSEPSAGDPTRHDWWTVIRDALRSRIDTVPVDGAAGAVLRALEAAGVGFPDRRRRPAPVTAEEHLEEAARLLELSVTADDTLPGGYHVADEHCRAQVHAAEVHARIAHAASALLMVGRAPAEPTEAPGLAVLERLAAAMEQSATGVELQGIGESLRALADTVDPARSAIRTRER